MSTLLTAILENLYETTERLGNIRLTGGQLVAVSEIYEVLDRTRSLVELVYQEELRRGDGKIGPT